MDYLDAFLATVEHYSTDEYNNYKRNIKRYLVLRKEGKTHAEAIYEITHKKDNELSTAKKIEYRINNYLDFVQLQEGQIMMDFEDKATDIQEPTQATDNDTVNAGGFEQAIEPIDNADNAQAIQNEYIAQPVQVEQHEQKKRNVGRPKNISKNRKAFNLQLPHDMYDKLDILAKYDERSITDIILNAISEYMNVRNADIEYQIQYAQGKQARQAGKNAQ